MCTTLMLKVPSTTGQPAGPPLYVSSRAMEMPGVIEQNVYVVPKGQEFPLGQVPFLIDPPGWTSTIGFVGIAASGATWEDAPNFNDGINTAGLSVGALWLQPGTKYPLGGDNPVSYFEFPGWILGQFSTVAELKPALLGTNVGGSDETPPAISVVGPLDDGVYQNYFVPLHYIVTDATGASIIIEFVDGVIHVHDSDNGVMANAPTYDWQKTNVDNYDHVSLVGGATHATGTAPPLGGSLVGLPGDSLSASRFIRAWYLSQGFGQLPPDGTGWLPAPGGETPGEGDPPGFADPEQTAVVVALQLVQICMGTPYGMLLEAAPKSTSDQAGATPAAKDPPTVGDYTMWTSVRDHSNLAYYFMSAFSGILTKVDLTEIDFDSAPTYPNCNALQVLPQPGVAWCVDATTDLKPAAALV
ncbi:MAG TPA: linear amide C-N hydrolase [Solirubrobacteraceae bacterium]|nr:linear amide C-N hydrolase [Solirubrobacteraceae bacterium]